MNRRHFGCRRHHRSASSPSIRTSVQDFRVRKRTQKPERPADRNPSQNQVAAWVESIRTRAFPSDANAGLTMAALGLVWSDAGRGTNKCGHRWRIGHSGRQGPRTVDDARSNAKSETGLEALPGSPPAAQMASLVGQAGSTRPGESSGKRSNPGRLQSRCLAGSVGDSRINDVEKPPASISGEGLTLEV